jgi:hypothetical protein
MGRWPAQIARGLEIGTQFSYNTSMGMLDVIVVVGLVSVLYLYLKQSNEQ